MADLQLDIHRDAALFRDALGFTAAETGFSERMVEKDYFCSVALADLCGTDATEIVFKGGTCLSKVHAEFFRLSEDLDFAISVPAKASRGQRGKLMEGVRRYFAALPRRQGCFVIDQALRGFNNSSQYGARLGYQSVITGQLEHVKVEVSVREPILEQPVQLPARTVLLHPFRKSVAITPFVVRTLTVREAYAEKLRAALSRREPAIRDFFDLDHAFAVGVVKESDPQLIRLLRSKLAIPGNDPIDTSNAKLAALRGQVAELHSVVREQDFQGFDLERAFNRIAAVAQALGQ